MLIMMGKTFGDQIVRNVAGWALAVYGSLFVNHLFDQAAVTNDSHGPRAELERKQATILLGPFFELNMSVR